MATGGLAATGLLPLDHSLLKPDADSKDVVKLVMGLIATIAALVLGLLIASANTGSYSAFRQTPTWNG